MGRPQPVRSLHHPRRPRFDDAGHLRQLVPDSAGTRLRHDHLRDGARHARHPGGPLDSLAGARTRPHISSKIRQYLGDARGRWEGNTLVVETTNFNDKVPYRGSSDQLRIVERFTPIGPDTLEWAITFDDAAHLGEAMDVRDEPDARRVAAAVRYACHEGNYGLRNILSAARAEERMRALAEQQRK